MSVLYGKRNGNIFEAIHNLYSRNELCFQLNSNVYETGFFKAAQMTTTFAKSLKKKLGFFRVEIYERPNFDCKLSSFSSLLCEGQLNSQKEF